MFLSRVLLLFTLTWLIAFSVEAQRRRQPNPNDTLQSTEVSADHKVTFRIYAPKADEVTVSGDFGESGRMTKDSRGVWSIQVGPLTPDFYNYQFVVDGVTTVDPKNPMVKPGISSVNSMLLVPGKEAEFEATRNVPHGEVRAHWYYSRNLSMSRRMHVYTPPGYEAGTEKYPIFYLLHGGGDEDSGWSSIGRAGFILDNLLAENKAVPMIVVMPNGSLPRSSNMPPRPARGETPSPEYLAAREAHRDQFTVELLDEVIPVVERTYRVNLGPQNRCLAGLSMGGAQTLRVLTTNPDQFAYAGIWSAGLSGGNAEVWARRNERFLASAGLVNRTVKQLEIVVGDQDFAAEGSRALAELFQQHGIDHELRITSGGHTWINWRRYLRDLSKRLFR